MLSSARQPILGFALALAILIADQLSKLAVLAHVADKTVAILPIFNLLLVWNHGVSFGMFNHGEGPSPVVFMILSLLIAGGFSFWLLRAPGFLLSMALGLTIGGAVGNVIDRALHGAVVDFLDFHIGAWHWPAFNIADSAIVIGIALIVFDGLFLSACKDSQHRDQKDAE